MLNIPLFICFVFIVIFIAGIIYLAVVSLKKYAITAQTIVVPATTLCNPDRTTLVQVDTSQNVCCYNNGVPTGAFFVQTSAPSIIPGNPPVQLQFSAIPTLQTFYVTVCSEYCNSGYTLTATRDILCNGETTITQPQSLLANECASITAPFNPDGTPCRGSALPIAV